MIANCVADGPVMGGAPAQPVMNNVAETSATPMRILNILIIILWFVPDTRRMVIFTLGEDICQVFFGAGDSCLPLMNRARLEQVEGIEPSLKVWKTLVLPLNYTYYNRGLSITSTPLDQRSKNFPFLR